MKGLSHATREIELCGLMRNSNIVAVFSSGKLIFHYYGGERFKPEIANILTSNRAHTYQNLRKSR